MLVLIIQNHHRILLYINRRLQISNRDKTVESQGSSNAHAILNQCFTNPGVYYWTFSLDTDVLNDEMTCFGAADTNNISNSSYENSPNLYMYRAFNGQLYQCGTKKAVLDKVHPQDKVTVELNLISGTISYSVNKQPFKLAFTDIKPPIYPAVCFYGAGKKISIVSVEVPKSVSNDYKTLENVEKEVIKGKEYDNTFSFKGTIPSDFKAYSISKDNSLDLIINIEDDFYHVVGKFNIIPPKNLEGVIKIMIIDKKDDECNNLFEEEYSSIEPKEISFDICVKDIKKLQIKAESNIEDNYTLGIIDTLFYTKYIYENIYPSEINSLGTKEDCVISYLSQLINLSDAFLNRKSVVSCSEFLYCYEMSNETFKTFSLLFNYVKESKKYCLLAPIQKLLLNNINAMNKSKIDPKSFNFYSVDENGKYTLSEEISSLQNDINYFLKIIDKIPEESVVLFSQIIIKGSTLFYPNAADRNTTTLSYILNLSDNQVNSTFVSNVISILSYDNEILNSLFQGIFACKDDIINSMLPIFHSLLDTIYNLIINNLEGKNNVENKILDSAIHFLFNYFYYFFLHVIQSFDNNFNFILTEYLQSMLQVIQKLTKYVIDKDINKDILNKFLNYSLVKDMLPLFFLFIYSVADDTYLSSKLIPIIVQISIDWDKICSKDSHV